MESILLVIEDDHVAEILRAILSEQMPVEALPTVHSGNEALVYLRQHTVNALIIEATAQILDRFPLQTLIQRRYPTLPLVVLGGEPAASAADAPSLKVVPAPFSMATIEAALLGLVIEMRAAANASPPPAAQDDDRSLFDGGGQAGLPDNAQLAAISAAVGDGAGFVDGAVVAGRARGAIVPQEAELGAAGGFAPPLRSEADALLNADGDHQLPAAAQETLAGETGVVLGKNDAGTESVQEALAAAMQIDGALGVALVDYQSGMALGAQGDGTLDLEVAAAGNSDVIRAKLRVMEQMGLGDSIEDMLITLGSQYHLIRLLRASQGLFVYLVLNRGQANLAMARHKLSQIEATLNL